MTRHLFLLLSALSGPVAFATAATEFCLDGQFNLGARLQGTAPGVDEFVPARWCVVTDDDSRRVRFGAEGRSNPDLEGSWTVVVLPPDLVRIVNADDPPDIEFHGADARSEARRLRRIDPRRLLEEHRWAPLTDVEVTHGNGRLHSVSTTADLPLRGRVPVVWHWSWPDLEHPQLNLVVDGALFFSAAGAWRQLDDEEAAKVWQATPGAEPVQVPGQHWPARIDMRLVELADGVHLVRGVRTGFQHLVVETGSGLVVADAPAGWVELHQIPPTDLVPGLGISGLSERFVDFLAAELPDRPIRAVALTHGHDDHAGGARAFAAAGARIYAPAETAEFLERALNRDSMPADRLSEEGGRVQVIPVTDTLTLEGDRNTVKLLSVGAGPHSAASLGVLAAEAGYFFVSDLHVPAAKELAPRRDRAATECWFARWAGDALPHGTTVLNAHSTPQTPLASLVAYLEHDICKAAR